MALLPATAELPDAMAGGGYTVRFEMSGAVGEVSYRLVAGALPAGLKLDADGELSGAPVRPGRYSFTVAAEDAAGQVASRTYSLRVDGLRIYLPLLRR